MTDREKILLDNAAKLAEHHRKHCEGESCDISLILLMELLSKAKIDIPSGMVKRFI